jgi:hypothetical protein
VNALRDRNSAVNQTADQSGLLLRRPLDLADGARPAKSRRVTRCRSCVPLGCAYADSACLAIELLSWDIDIRERKLNESSWIKKVACKRLRMS